jgi:DNA-binding NarL/FixJ family response regulator
MSDKMEILRMAFTHAANGQEALSLAERMVAFVNGESKPLSTKAVIVPINNGSIPNLGIIERNNLSRERCHYTERELEDLLSGVHAGMSVSYIARAMKRSKGAIKKAIDRKIWLRANKGE